jgi:hypothetical protein
MEVVSIDRIRIATALRSGWQAMRVLQNEPTLDILRYVVSDEDDALVVEGDSTLVPGLTDILVAAFPRLKKRKRIDGLISYGDSDLVFIIYDTEVLLTDKILYQGMRYEVLDVAWHSSSGKCRFEASRVK